MYKIYFDLETSSLKHDCDITQIGAVAVLAETFQILETYEVKLIFDPEKATPEALVAFGYNKLTWENEAVSPELGIAHLSDFFNKYRCIEKISKTKGTKYKVASCVAHNAPFDKERLEAFYRKYEMFLPVDHIWRDTLQMAVFYDDLIGASRGSYSLDALCKVFRIERQEPHDALSDALACMEVHRFIYEQLRPTFEI